MTNEPQKYGRIIKGVAIKEVQSLTKNITEDKSLAEELLFGPEQCGRTNGFYSTQRKTLRTSRELTRKLTCM